jgi:hypothetical protein
VRTLSVPPQWIKIGVPLAWMSLVIVKEIIMGGGEGGSTGVEAGTWGFLGLHLESEPRPGDVAMELPEVPHM